MTKLLQSLAISLFVCWAVCWAVFTADSYLNLGWLRRYGKQVGIVLGLITAIFVVFSVWVLRIH